MASKKFLELQEFSKEELLNELTETQVQYEKLKLDHAIKGLENPLIIKEVRKDIARLQTETRKRELAELTPEALALRSKKRLRRRKK